MFKWLKTLFNNATPIPEFYDTCPICSNQTKFPVSTFCGHLFCLKCIHQSCESSNFCPVCKTKIGQDEFIPVLPKEMKIDFKKSELMQIEEYRVIYEDKMNLDSKIEDAVNRYN